MFGMIPFVKAAGRGLGALIKGRKGKETLKKKLMISALIQRGWKSKSMMMAALALLEKPSAKR